MDELNEYPFKTYNLIIKSKEVYSESDPQIEKLLFDDYGPYEAFKWICSALNFDRHEIKNYSVDRDMLKNDEYVQGVSRFIYYFVEFFDGSGFDITVDKEECPYIKAGESQVRVSAEYLSPSDVAIVKDLNDVRDVEDEDDEDEEEDFF